VPIKEEEEEEEINAVGSMLLRSFALHLGSGFNAPPPPR